MAYYAFAGIVVTTLGKPLLMAVSEGVANLVVSEAVRTGMHNLHGIKLETVSANQTSVYLSIVSK